MDGSSLRIHNEEESFLQVGTGAKNLEPILILGAAIIQVNTLFSYSARC